jgi:ElaB/YqjD/DUF883 family membrane-anchored ribosome-binding protein
MDQMPSPAGRNRSANDALHKLIEDVKVLSRDTRDLLQHTAEQSGEHLATARDRMRERLSSVEARLGPVQRALTERVQQVSRISTQHVRRHPASTLAAAAAIALAVFALFAWQSENTRSREDEQ